MSFTDSLGDMLTRLRNGQRAAKEVVTCPGSRLRAAVLKVMREEGYIEDFKAVRDERGLAHLEIRLKYHRGGGAIRELGRLSRPGRRRYAGVEALPKIYDGLGIAVVSTSRGVMSDREARRLRAGGEVLCYVF